MSRPEIVELATAIKGHARRMVERHGRRSVEGIVVSLDPLVVTVDGLDDDLDENDITFGGALAAHLVDEPLEAGDTLALLEVSPGDYIATDVLPGGD